MAAVADVGSPSVRSGTRTPVTAELLVASGPATPSIAPVPNSSGCFGELALDRIGEERRYFGTARRQSSEREADEGAPQPGFPGASPFVPSHPDLPSDRNDLVGKEPFARHDEQRLAYGEQADREDHHLDPVEKLGHVHGEPRLTGLHIDADEADREPDEEARETSQERRAEDGSHGREGEDHEREVVGRAELQGQSNDRGREQGQRESRQRARHERTDGGGGERGGAATALRHLIALDGGHHRASSRRAY